MRLVGVQTLKPGVELAIPVSTSSGKVILNHSIILTDIYIDKLKQLGIHKVYISDSRFDDVVVDPPLDVNIERKVLSIMASVYETIHKEKHIDEFQIKGVAKDIVDYARDNKEKGVSILSIDSVDEYIIEHSINVAILTSFIGNRMTFNQIQLIDLVTGALIHDLSRENVREEDPEHVQKGFDIMRKYRGLSLHSSIVCYEHHENYDGSGYPRKLQGTSISEFSRVIRVADFYDDVLHGIYNDNIPLMPHQAYEYLLAASEKILDPEVVEVFRDTIVFYPNGCTVLLSNGLKGVVIRQNLGSPQRPVVRVYSDDSVLGEINLLKSLALFIKDVLVI